MSIPSAPSNLKKLNTQVFLSEPTGEDTSASADGLKGVCAPGLIILFGWMNAKLPHVQKYADVLRGIYPASTIVVVMVDSNFYWLSEKTKESTLAPVLATLNREKENGNLDKGILLYVMSNGGGFQLAILQKMLTKSPLNAPQQPPIAMLLDSLPGDDGFESAMNGSRPSQPILRILSTPIIILMYGVFHLLNMLAGNLPIFTGLRIAVHEPAGLPNLSEVASSDLKAAPRLYIYSETDRITMAKNVKRHIDEARGKGYDVTVERYEKSPHVAHARTDPERYWTAFRGKGFGSSFY
ncbi:hypothetical protein NLJ89_g2660 [Agrocybe chaxingu]|uniref:Indole-diterpene biosynthesis protein PaxU n=1 Tax=Agrocybe chaxingu TaxID=84603 RepID=A0A9W8K6E8_9AGAR|nr:hypothetical protein NLJ89_g2660 [Agrocybe chaxingu]